MTKIKKTYPYVLVVAAFFLIVTIYADNLTVPGDLLYPVHRAWNYLTVMLQNTPYDKAKQDLIITTDLFDDFSTLKSHNMADPHLLSIADEFVTFESHAMIQMDLAKKQGKNIKDEAETLCELLEHQNDQLKQLATATAPSLQPKLIKTLHITSIDLQKAMSWE